MTQNINHLLVAKALRHYTRYLTTGEIMDIVRTLSLRQVQEALRRLLANQWVCKDWAKGRRSWALTVRGRQGLTADERSNAQDYGFYGDKDPERVRVINSYLGRA
jgi:hypothetical protein